MSIIKKTMASFLVIAAALVSTSAMAAGPTDAVVRAAAESTVAKMEEAVSLMDKGADKADVLKAMSEVRQLQKEFRFEGTERLRQKAGDKMKVARDEIEKGDANGAASLKATRDMYKEALKIYNAAH